jgi:hypothetical protein
VILFIESQKPDDSGFRGLTVLLLEDGRVAGGINQWLPLMRWRERQVELQVKIDADKACDVFGSLDIPGHPMNRIGDPAEQRPFYSNHDAAACGFRLSTHVSLLPPP